jgi:TolB-like protein
MSSTDDLTATKELNERTKEMGSQRVAILYFDNTGENSSMDQLRKGLADMLITDLSNVRMLDIVERDRLESLLEEQNLSNSSDFDPETAARLGELLGADIILTGGYFDLFGSIRIDARFIDVETGQVLKSDGVDGESSKFFKIQKQLSWKIINNMDAKLTDEEIKTLEEQENSSSPSLDDLNRYSEALNYYDSGSYAQSKEIVETFLEKYPDFEPALRLLEKLNTR